MEDNEPAVTTLKYNPVSFRFKWQIKEVSTLLNLFLKASMLSYYNLSNFHLDEPLIQEYSPGREYVREDIHSRAQRDHVAEGFSKQELAQCSPVLTISFAAPFLPSSPSSKLHSGRLNKVTCVTPLDIRIDRFAYFWKPIDWNTKKKKKMKERIKQWVPGKSSRKQQNCLNQFQEHTHTSGPTCMFQVVLRQSLNAAIQGRQR